MERNSWARVPFEEVYNGTYLFVKYFYFCVDVFQGLQGLPGDKGIRVSYQASLGLCTVVEWSVPEPLKDS